MNTNTKDKKNRSKSLFIWAWILGLFFYFIDYATRSVPSLMIGDLSELFEVSKQEVIAISGSYYYAYALFALVAGIALDKLGARFAMFAGCFILGIGCILFIVSNSYVGEFGRLLQGAGSAFAFPGCVYLASKGFSSKYLATAIGVTQCIGMLGGAAGQFAVAPLLTNGFSFVTFWIISGILCIIPAVLMLIFTPKPDEVEIENRHKSTFLAPYKIIFSNKTSWMTGIISGLLFVPTTIFAMTWAVPYFKLDLGYAPEDAAITAAMAALGWVVGCPLMGYFADRIGKRKPVIVMGCAGMILMLWGLMYGTNLIPAKLILFVFGVFSGVAMLPYSIIKEANPDHVKGSATGAQNFLTFGVTSLIGPLFAALYGNKLPEVVDRHTHFNQSIWFWILGILLALLLTMRLQDVTVEQKA